MSARPLDVAAGPTARRAARRPAAATVVGLAASAVMLAVLYRTLDLASVGHALAKANRAWLVVSVGLILPITVLRAARFYWVAPRGAMSGVLEALRLTLLSSALNVFVPAKGGDLAKSYFVSRHRGTSGGVSLAIVVYERLCDLVGLTGWCVLGWLLSPASTSRLPAAFWILLGVAGAACGVLTLSTRAAVLVQQIVRALLPRRTPDRLVALVDGWPALLHDLGWRRGAVVLFSVGLWLTHLLQLWLFTRALGVAVPFWVSASLSAVALMAGQLPLTFAGLGARDVALVVLFARHMPAETAAAMGILTASRNLLPPLLGAPLIGPYLSSAVGDARRWQRTRGERG
jgi:uncharacterized protein (TIRG00374 family)